MSNTLKSVTRVQIHKINFLRRSISSSTLVLALDHQPVLTGFCTLVIIRERLQDIPHKEDAGRRFMIHGQYL